MPNHILNWCLETQDKNARMPSMSEAGICGESFRYLTLHTNMENGDCPLQQTGQKYDQKYRQGLRKHCAGDVEKMINRDNIQNTKYNQTVYRDAAFVDGQFSSVYSIRGG